MFDRVIKCALPTGDDAFRGGEEYTLFADDTVADDNGELRLAFVAINGVVAGDSFFTILRVK